jgi:phosphomannomutase
VRQNGCALGFAFDGDGDRVGMVDETGEIGGRTN